MIAKVFLAVFGIFVVVEGQLLGGFHAPKPYRFGYNVKDAHGQQHREETGDGASGVRGSYGFTDARGVQRQVNYVADHAGFRAQVKTNEPGTANQDPAAVNIISSAHPYYGAGVGSIGLGLTGAVAPSAIGISRAGLGLGHGLASHGIVAPFGIGYGGPGAGFVNRYDSRIGVY